MNNGQPPSKPPPQQPGGAEQGEPVSYEDVIDYYRELTNNLHAQLAVARGQIANRDRVISQLQQQVPFIQGMPIRDSEPEPVSKERP